MPPERIARVGRNHAEAFLIRPPALPSVLSDKHTPPPVLMGQRHFRRPYKHEAQASVCLTRKHTRLRFVLVFPRFHAQVAVSNE